MSVYDSTHQEWVGGATPPLIAGDERRAIAVPTSPGAGIVGLFAQLTGYSRMHVGHL